MQIIVKNFYGFICVVYIDKYFQHLQRNSGLILWQWPLNVSKELNIQ